MLSQTTSYDHPTDKDHVDCVEQGGSNSYPVLHIGDTVIWPTREQLVAIRDVIQGYLDAHPIPATPAFSGLSQVDETGPLELTEYTDAEIQEMF